MLYFITGNKGKFQEVEKIIPQIKQLDIDLPEIQEIDAKKIAKAKLQEALKHKEGEFVLEDTSLYFDALNGLPGPLIKWFLKALGDEGLFDLLLKYKNNKAIAKTIVAYAKSKNKIYFFEAVLEGEIVKPRGENGFGWDKIFQPKNSVKTFAEMSDEEKNKISMRKMAFEKFIEFYKN